MKKIIALLLCLTVVISVFTVSSAESIADTWYVYYGSQYASHKDDTIYLKGAPDYRAKVTERGGTLYSTNITFGGTTRTVYGVASYRDFTGCSSLTTANAHLNYTNGGGYTKGKVTY